MAKRKAKKTIKQAASSSESVKVDGAEEKEAVFLDSSVERQIAAIKAVRDVEIEHLLTGLRLLRSYFNEEQLQTPVLQYFKANLPNLSVVRNGQDGEFEVQWNDKDANISMNHTDSGDMHTSLLQRLSIAHPDCSAAIPTFNGFELSSKSVKTSFLDVDNLQFKDIVLEEPPNTQMIDVQDALRTPGVSSQRLSVGMTPKTLRLPKHGEMLLSVRGSPLGVYKEDNMEAIHESEEG